MHSSGVRLDGVREATTAQGPYPRTGNARAVVEAATDARQHAAGLRPSGADSNSFRAPERRHPKPCADESAGSGRAAKSRLRSWLQASAGMSDADDVGDSDVVADTYGVSAGQSRFSAGRNKRQKVDDAPTSASTLSEEQARVRDLVLAGKNVRPLACVCAQALGCARGVDV